MLSPIGLPGIADVRVGLCPPAPRSRARLPARPKTPFGGPSLCSSCPSPCLFCFFRPEALPFAVPPEDDRVCYKPNECGLLSRTGINSRPNWSALGCDSLTDNISIGGDACQHGLSARASAGLPGPACHAGGGPARISCWCLFAIRRSRPKFARLAPSSSENPVVHLAQNAPKICSICLR